MLRCSDAICQLLFWPLKISPGPATSDLSPLVSVRYHNIKIKYPFSFLTWKHAKISRPLFCCMLWVTYQTKTTFPIFAIIFILFTVIWILGWYLADIYCSESAPSPRMSVWCLSIWRCPSHLASDEHILLCLVARSRSSSPIFTCLSVCLVSVWCHVFHATSPHTGEHRALAYSVLFWFKP